MGRRAELLLGRCGGGALQCWVLVFKFYRAVLRVVMVGWVLDDLAAEDTLEGDLGACSSGIYCLVYSNCI